ncbi:MAG: tripartite tricarboxylate transporter substrate binding protein [Pseudomonadota bacterium]
MATGMARRLAAIAAVAVGLAGASATAQAPYPTRPIRFVVTFPPGGSADLVARAIAPLLTEQLGQALVIDNRPGAGGNIGLDIVAKAHPDGYTIGLGAAGGLAVNVSLYKSMPFDPVKDFAPVTMLAEIPFVLAAHPASGIATFGDLLTRARAKPGSLAIAHGGNGTAMHLSAQLLTMMAGVEITLVPYKGSGPATSDVLAGQVPLAMLDIPSSIGFIRDGHLSALGVTAAARVDVLPAVPTIAESGLAGYESVGWFGVVAPAGTPPMIVARLNQAIGKALRDPEITVRALAVGATPAPSTPAAFGATIRSEIAKWSKVIAVSGAQVE